MYESLIFRRCWPYVEFLTRFILGAIFYFIVFFNFRLEYSFDCEWLRRCVRCRNERRKITAGVGSSFYIPILGLLFLNFVYSLTQFPCLLSFNSRSKREEEETIVFFIFSLCCRKVDGASSFPHLINVDTLCCV